MFVLPYDILHSYVMFVTVEKKKLLLLFQCASNYTWKICEKNENQRNGNTWIHDDCFLFIWLLDLLLLPFQRSLSIYPFVGAFVTKGVYIIIIETRHICMYSLFSLWKSLTVHDSMHINLLLYEKKIFFGTVGIWCAGLVRDKSWKKVLSTAVRICDIANGIKCYGGKKDRRAKRRKLPTCRRRERKWRKKSTK